MGNRAFGNERALLAANVRNLMFVIEEGDLEGVMFRYADHHHHGVDSLLRANKIFSLGVVWVALGTCVILSAVYDIGHWLQVW